MKLILASILIVAVAADRLENTYLPPNGAHAAGGSGNFLNTPHHSPIRRPSDNNGRFSGSGSAKPQLSYGVPSGPAGGKLGQQSRDSGAKIVRYENENLVDGSYNFNFETENGIAHHESGELRNGPTNQEASFVEGSYSYTGDDGNVFTVNYIADENGFQPSGDHLPTSPPIPEAIQKSLDIIAAQGNGNYAHQGQGYKSNGQNFNQQSGYQY